MPIVVGVDETPVSERVLRKAIDEAKLRGEPLHVVHVYHPPLMYFATTLSEPVDFATHHREKVWERLTPLLEMSHIEWERVDLDGYPGDVLNDYANNVHASLIVIGTRGRGDLSSLLLGSTSAEVASHSHAPVAVIR